MRRLALTLAALAAGTTGLVTIGAGAASADDYLGDGSSTIPSIHTSGGDPETFYPRIRDGYRDGVRFVAYGAPIVDRATGNDYPQDLTTPQAWSIVVRNSSGYRVASHSETTGENDDPNWWVGGEWYWNGKNLAGVPVGVGTFKVTTTMTNTETGEKDTAVDTVYAKTAMTYPRTTKVRHPGLTSSRARTTSCRIDDVYVGADDDQGLPWGWELDLDCWGGRYALANYRFAVPSNATNVTFAVRGERGCCTNGRVIKTGSRVSSTRYNVRVKVTNWASFTVREVSLTYTQAVRR